jgi:hypothetical protein
MTLNITVVNSLKTDAAPPHVYLDPPGNNELVVTLTNDSGGQLALTHGKPVSERQAKSSPTTLICIAIQVTGLNAAGLSVEADGWTSAADAQGAWSLAPANDGQLGRGDSIAVRIGGWPAGLTASSGTIYVAHYHFGGLDPDYSSRPLLVDRWPSEHPLPIDFTFVARESTPAELAYISPVPLKPATEISNTLVISVANTDSGAIAGPWPPDRPPTFELLLPASAQPDPNSLLLIDYAQNVTVSPADTAHGSWDTKHDTQSGLARWTITPTSSPILDAHASAQFSISELIVPGPWKGVVPIYLHHFNFPGYDDGCQTLEVTKAEPSPGILHFVLLSPLNPPAGDPVALAWTTFALDPEQPNAVKLEYEQDDRAVTLASPADIAVNTSGYEVRGVETETTFMLTACKRDGTPIDTPGSNQAQLTVQPHQTKPWVGEIATTFSDGTSSLVVGQSVTFAFKAHNADTVRLELAGATPQWPIDLRVPATGVVSCTVHAEGGGTLSVSQDGRPVGPVGFGQPSGWNWEFWFTPRRGSEVGAQSPSVHIGLARPTIKLFKLYWDDNSFLGIQWDVVGASQIVVSPLPGRLASPSGQCRTNVQFGPRMGQFVLTADGFGSVTASFDPSQAEHE